VVSLIPYPLLFSHSLRLSAVDEIATRLARFPWLHLEWERVPAVHYHHHHHRHCRLLSVTTPRLVPESHVHSGDRIGLVDTVLRNTEMPNDSLELEAMVVSMPFAYAWNAGHTVPLIDARYLSVP